jgi:hypothetical protein
MLVLLMADDLWRRGGLRTEPEHRCSGGLMAHAAQSARSSSPST